MSSRNTRIPAMNMLRSCIVYIIITRMGRAVLIGTALVLAVGPGRTSAQVRTAGMVGYGGGGPVGVVYWKFDAEASLLPRIWATGSIAGFDHGHGICTHRIPSSCDGRATALSLGLTAAPARRSHGVVARLQASAYSFSGIDGGDRTFVEAATHPAVGMELGYRVRLVGPLYGQFAASAVHVLRDDEYVAAVGSRLRYRFLTVGMSYDW